MSRTSGNL